MNKLAKVCLLPLMALMILLPQDAQAQGVSVIIDDVAQDYSQPPVIKDGSTLVPLRGIFETLGADVNWNQLEQKVTATQDQTTIELVIGSGTATINNQEHQLSVPGQIVNNSTMVPLRFVSEALGAEVSWDQSTKTVNITSSSNDGSSVVTNDDMEIHFLDVGQGDSTLVILPNDKTLLIDAGSRSAGEKIVSYLKKAGITTIDYAVATHPHEDHIGGFIDVFNEFEVKNVLDSGYVHTTLTFENYLDFIYDNDIGFEVAERGATIDLDPGIDITVLTDGADENSIGHAHDFSVSLYIEYNDFSAIFTGDAETELESDMVNHYGDQLNAQIYQVGHHGSNTSSTQLFLDHVQPEIAYFSFGEGNAYGHPHDEVVQRMAAMNIEMYYATQGDLIVTTNGKNYSTNQEPQSIEIDDAKKDADESEEHTGLININTADKELLQEITGVGPAIAKRIIEYRENNGPFERIEQIMNVSGIAEGRFADMKDEITV
ncbi:stalk domain-containing protein [Desertibacillus haloalkaliphilus]|uniref:stalk domain-containing protein n=1 Tax=Desertibacillus haloalkaliphilus TaxID=1328930 RepID=UPI001C263C38|nr:stalk domain-containing protein [Desertibacillus haloalkaliphilus]MBU8908147.1 helix-hairpin-helix domain-containing protein [Desertibacillus haloalkaliphilus]